MNDAALLRVVAVVGVLVCPQVAGAQDAPDQPDDDLELRPLLGVGGGIMYNVERNRNFASSQRDVAVTVAISRVGVTGTVGHGVSFKVEYERSLGSENGSGVWEGTAGWGALEQWVRFERAGFRADAGVVFDEATAVFGSAHAGGLFYRDRYTRNIGLWGGAFFGQGVIAKYQPVRGLHLGVAYASANPLSHSNSFLIDGTSGGATRFYAASLLNSSFGQPSSAIHFQTVTGSARYERGGLTAQTSGAWLQGDAKTNSDEDRLLTGWIFRIGARYQLGRLRGFGNASYMYNRAQDRAISSEYADYDNDVLFASAGVDAAITGRAGVGVWWAGTQRQLDEEMDPRYREHWLNVGASYWPHRRFYAQLRFGYFRQDIDNTAEDLGQQQELAVFATSTLQL